MSYFNRRFVIWFLFLDAILYGGISLVFGQTNSLWDFLSRTWAGSLLALLVALWLDDKWSKLSSKTRFMASAIFTGLLSSSIVVIALNSPASTVHLGLFGNTLAVLATSFISIVALVYIRYRKDQESK